MKDKRYSENIKEKYCKVDYISDNPKVSVIIPSYNVEKYIEKCLGSINKQTLKDIEIIVVDDGSKDGTREIINTFADIDKRIITVFQENSGVSSARNKGISLAKGEFTTFIDSDDWVDENYLEKLYSAVKNNNCDIGVATIIRKREHSQKYRVFYIEEKVVSNLEEKVQLCKIPVCCYACGKLFKTSLIKDFKFKEGVYFEDVLWTPQVLAFSDKLVTVPNISYWYRVNNNSIVKKVPSKKKQLDSYRAKKFVTNFLKEKEVELPQKACNYTKEIKYLFGVPLLKIKEYNNTLTTLLFGFIPIKKQKLSDSLKYKNIKQFLFFKNLDAHYYIEIFKSIKIAIKNNKKFDYKKVCEYGLTKEKRQTQIIVSLTSFPQRINTVELTVNTLLNQTVKPDRLILWLSENQFPNKEEDLPSSLVNLKQYGLEIRWCEDIKSYKKLIPALREFPNDIIVTADDDLYYQRDWLESLYNEYKKNPNFIYTRRACGVNIKNNTISIKPHYANNNYKPTYLNQLMGGEGTLYQPNSLHHDVLNTEQIKSLIPTHDDIYFWTMALLKRTKICLVKNKDVNLYTVENSQNYGLCKQNKKNEVGMSPKEAFTRIFVKYPNVFELIEEESL